MISADKARKNAGIERYDANWVIKDLNKYIEQVSKKGERNVTYILDACSKGLTIDEVYLVWSVLDQKDFKTRKEDVGPGIYKMFISW